MRSSRRVDTAVQHGRRRAPDRPEAVRDGSERLAHVVRIGEPVGQCRHQHRSGIVARRPTPGRPHRAASRAARRSRPRGRPRTRACTGGRRRARPEARPPRRRGSCREPAGNRTRRWPRRAARSMPATRAAASGRWSSTNSGSTSSGSIGCSATARAMRSSRFPARRRGRSASRRSGASGCAAAGAGRAGRSGGRGSPPHLPRAGQRRGAGFGEGGHGGAERALLADVDRHRRPARRPARAARTAPSFRT